MTLLHAVILGVVQGASEFLPISSSGHLVIVQQLLGIDLEAGPLVAFDVCLHLGTLIAVVAALRTEVWMIIEGVCNSLRGRRSFTAGTSALVQRGRARNPRGAPSATEGGFTVGPAMHSVWLVVLGTIPAVIIGFSFKSFFEGLFSSRLPVGIALLITGTVLFATRWVKRHDVDAARMRWWHAVIVGCAQALAIFPGISRSGSTISAGLFARLDRQLAAKFSFLLSIPAIGGAAVLQADNLRYLSATHILPTVIGTLVSAAVGYACVKWILAIMRGRNFPAFAYYCWAVGVGIIVWSLFT